MSENEGVPIPVFEDEQIDWQTLRVTQWGDGDIDFVRVPLEGNLVIGFGAQHGAEFRVAMTEKHTAVNRLKWWCFCRIFPFRIVKWEGK